MSDRVCQGGQKANKSDDSGVAIGPESMEKAVYFGIVPDELTEAGKDSVTHDEMHHYRADDLMHDMSYGLTAWRAVAFALERDLPLPDWVLRYLADCASGIEQWAMLNGHPGELKDVLGLGGKRIHRDDSSDPRWIYDAISQLRASNPKASIKSLVQMFLKEFPDAGDQSEERIRQKYYQGKKLAETGQDYKGRGHKTPLDTSPMMPGSVEPDDIDFK